MGKFLDAGQEMDGGKKKKNNKKGFKSDRRENYERMIAKKTTGKDIKKKETKPVRVKSITFDSNSLRDYVLTLHKKKNERRVLAFVDAKRKLRRDNSKTRQQQREEARRAYNNYARVPILPNYTFQMPSYAEDGGEFGEEQEDYDEEEEAEAEAEQQQQQQAEVSDAEEDDALPWMYLGDGREAPPEAADDEAEAEAAMALNARKRRRAKAQATAAHSTHVMPLTMTGDDDADGGGIDAETVTVEVKPLNFRANLAPTPAAAGEKAGRGRQGAIAASTLPSHNFSDLPAVVEQELRRLRQETKGPTRTKPKTHMMKELEKIRKIKKHSRKGHGKKSSSGKRKNRKK